MLVALAFMAQHDVAMFVFGIALTAKAHTRCMGSVAFSHPFEVCLAHRRDQEVAGATPTITSFALGKSPYFTHGCFLIASPSSFGPGVFGPEDLASGSGRVGETDVSLLRYTRATIITGSVR